MRGRAEATTVELRDDVRGGHSHAEVDELEAPLLLAVRGDALARVPARELRISPAFEHPVELLPEILEGRRDAVLHESGVGSGIRSGSVLERGHPTPEGSIVHEALLHFLESHACFRELTHEGEKLAGFELEKVRHAATHPFYAVGTSR